MGARRIDPITIPSDRADLAYIAGLVDGEGCITILSAFDKLASVNKSHTVNLVISNTNERLVIWLRQAIGGSIHCRGVRVKGWKPLFDWYLCGKNASLLLRAILPFLILKKDQAQLAIEFAQYRPSFKVGEPLTKEVVEIRESARLRMNALNKRGA